jgi:alpha-galactosidase
MNPELTVVTFNFSGVRRILPLFRERNEIMKKTLVLIVLFLTVPLWAQKFSGLALTPPMGWNSWNKFGGSVNEALIRETADAMVSSGMKDAGYQYVNIDDCWHGQRDELGFIQADPKRFPSGMKALADYVHSKGLKFGIYSDAGWKTCAGKPGSRGYEYQDAMMYAKWGVDYLKYDWCNTEGLNTRGAYLTMRDALYDAGRPIVFSICEWGSSKPWTWAKDVGHLWRTTGDITAIFDGVDDHGNWKSLGIMQILDKQEGLRVYAGPGHWNDPDMMEVGNGMSVNEDRAHFSMWCMLAAPLIAGNDLRNMTDETIAILTNRGAIAINQDPLGIQGFKYESENGLETWVKPLAKDQWAVCFLNRSRQPHEINFVWKDHPIDDSFSKRKIDFTETPCKITDVWAGKEITGTQETLSAKIPAHDVLMLRLEPLNR